MKSYCMRKAIPTAFAFALATGQAVANTPYSASPLFLKAENYEVKDKPLIARDLVKEISADNTAQITARHVGGTTISLAFSKVSLSQGAVLEISSPSRSEAHIYTAQELSLIFKRFGSFNAIAINGDTAIVRLIYPLGAKPIKGDTLVLSGYAVSLAPIISSEMDFSHRRSVACFKVSHPDLVHKTDAIGMLVTRKFNGGTGWLLGTGNSIMTNNHVVGKNGVDKIGALPGQSIWFNYQTAECDPIADPTATLADIIKIRLGSLIATYEGDEFQDWSLLSLNALEYREAGIKTLFGGLALADRKADGETVGLVGHGVLKEDIFNELPDGELFESPVRREKRAMLKDYQGKTCTFMPVPDVSIPDTIPPTYAKDQYYSQCESAGGDSGAPLFSLLDNKVVGLNQGKGGVYRGSAGLPGNFLLSELRGRAADPQTAVAGTGQVRKAYRDFAAFNAPQGFSFKGSDIRFSPIVKGRTLSHKANYSLLKSIALDNQGKQVDVLFRLVQETPCGIGNLATTCLRAGVTTLKVSIAPSDNAQQIPLGHSVIGWLPLAVKSSGKLIDNQVIHYQYNHYNPQQSPFAGRKEIIRKVMKSTGENVLTPLIRVKNFRTGMTAVRLGEGPLSDVHIGSSELGTAYSGMTPLRAEVVQEHSGKKYVINLRSGLINNCTKIVSSQGNWTPMNSSACHCAATEKNQFTTGSVYLLREDNGHLPAGRYLGLLPLMIRQWDTRETQPVELAIDYLVK